MRHSGRRSRRRTVVAFDRVGGPPKAVRRRRAEVGRTGWSIVLVNSHALRVPAARVANSPICSTPPQSMAADSNPRGHRMGQSKCVKCQALFALGDKLQFLCPTCRPAVRATRPDDAGRGGWRPAARSQPAPLRARPSAAAPKRRQKGMMTSRVQGRRSKSMASIVAKLDRGGRPTAQGRVRAVPARQRVCRICAVHPPMANADVCYSCNPE